jgi:predicted NAD/FAD-binding protein
VGLELGADYELADEHIPPLTYEAFSASAQEMTRYKFFLFLGKIHAGSLAKLDGNPDNYWATGQEVSIGATQLGKRIAGQVQKVRKMRLESGSF